jgi:prepilin-type processing-associated H-X9-DG protein
MAILLLAISVLFFPPHLIYTRDVNDRVKSATNLRYIGQTIRLYCIDYQGQYPDTFQQLLASEDVTSAIFVNPASNDTPAIGPTTQAAADQLLAGGHCSYLYLGRGLTDKTVAPNTIVAYEIPGIPNVGTNVLYGDGHVEWQNADYATKLIAKASSGQFPVTMP